MEIPCDYEKYAQKALADFRSKDAAGRNLLVDAVKDRPVEAVLDVGCGAGQELLPFLEKTGAFCVGIDSGEKLGKVTQPISAETERLVFVRSTGEKLPFAAASFDVVLCRVALPYMNNRETIAEVSRILKPNGIFLLKTHAPLFYLGMMQQRLKTLSAKQMAYPLICLAASFWHLLTGKQLQKGFWQGKEIFQTRSFLEKETAKNNLKIEGVLPDNNRQTPSFMIVKIALLKLFIFAQYFGYNGFDV
jgi:ubiquinone/menaquinone biosynthesis C-methylase UbiE